MSSSVVVRAADMGEIEEHLLRLGGGNHEDNMSVLRQFRRGCLLSLSEEDFMDLVFLKTPRLSSIVPADSDRRLAAVAKRALALDPSQEDQGANWNLSGIVDRWLAGPSSRSPLLLRDATASELETTSAKWYIQDGCHRALARCMAVLSGRSPYIGQLAYCATHSDFEV